MKYNDLKKQLQLVIFSKQDLKLLLTKVFDYQLTLWQKKGYIIKIKNGLYVLAEAADSILPEEVAGWIYSPSYISMETALANYGFISGKVNTLTCITSRINRKFENKYGSFIYRHLKPSLFFGYWEVKSRNFQYLAAQPEKALLDYLYLNLDNLKISSSARDLGLDEGIIKEVISKPKLKKYLAYFYNEKLTELCKNLVGKF